MQDEALGPQDIPRLRDEEAMLTKKLAYERMRRAILDATAVSFALDEEIARLEAEITILRAQLHRLNTIPAASPDFVAWKKAAERYREKVQRLYGTLRGLGKLEPVPLERLFTDVYTLDKLTAQRRFTTEERKTFYATGEVSKNQPTRRLGLEVVQARDKLFILGKPGAGKTTFLKFIALQALRGGFARTPIFVSLKELADSGLTILDFLIAEFAVCNVPDARPFVEHLLAEGEALVLFDGLDEVQEMDAKQSRASISAMVTAFTRRYDANQYLITCRLSATEYIFQQFTYVEIADFSEDQIHTFISKWFQDDAERGRHCLSELAMSHNRGLHQLAQSPLLLSLLCLTYEETLHFPERRVELYEDAVNALLDKWDASRAVRRDEVYRTLSLGHKRQLLARLAATTFERGVYFIPQSQVEAEVLAYLRGIPSLRYKQEVDRAAVVRAIEVQHGLLIKQVDGIYSFAQPSLQEYFAARHLVEQAVGRSDILEKLVRNYLTEPRWREVFLIIASFVGDATSLLNLMRQHLESTVQSQSEICGLLAWAAQKAVALQTPYPPAGMRAFYLSLGLYPTRGRGLNLARACDPDLDLALGQSGGRDLARDLAVALALAHAPTLVQATDLNLTLDRTLACALIRTRALARHYSRSHSLKRAQTRTRAFVLELTRTLALDLTQASKVSQQLGLQLLDDALAALVRSIGDASSDTWDSFTTSLEVIMSTHRQWREWSFSEDDLNLLNKYLNGSRLLVDSLELAYVTEPERIKARLLLPPGT